MRKYSVHFINRFNIRSYIHIFADSEKDAVQYVKDTGIGFSNGRTEFAKEVLYAIEVE